MRCEICNSNKVKFLYKLRDRLYHVDKKLFNLFKCDNCETIFIHPKPSQKELKKYYPENYISKHSKKDSRNAMIDLLYRTYFTKKGKWYFKILFFPIKNLLRTLPKKGKILDVGCGNGKFLNYCKNYGLEVYGIDPFIDKDIPELNIKKIDLLKADFPDEFFDYITLNNVIEHVPEPEKIIRKCKKMLKHDGKIIFNYPSTSSFHYKYFGKNWVSMDTPRHLFLFSDKAMRLLLMRDGLKIIKLRNKSEPFSLIGSYLYKKGEENLDKNKKLGNFLINLIVFPFSIILNFIGLGDSKEIIVKKLNKSSF